MNWFEILFPPNCKCWKCQFDRNPKNKGKNREEEFKKFKDKRKTKHGLTIVDEDDRGKLSLMEKI
jgi:predicted small metal-binding protein